MADLNGINFDSTLPADTSSVKSGAAEMRNIRNRLRDWAGGLFDTIQATATFKSSVVPSTALATPSGSAASATSTAVIAGDPTYSAVQVNSAGQVIKAAKATLNELSTISDSKLAVTNLSPSATGLQFLRTNAAADNLEWATSSVVSRWDTSQVLSFSQVPNDTATGGIANANIKALGYDGQRFCLGGESRYTRFTRTLLDFAASGDAGTVTNSAIEWRAIAARTDSNVVSTQVQCVSVGYDSAQATAKCRLVTHVGPAADNIDNGFDTSTAVRTITAGNTFLSASIRSVAFGGTTWAFVGDAGKLFTLPSTMAVALATALTPTEVSTGLSSGTTLNGIAWNGSSFFIAVGASGTIVNYTPGGSVINRSSTTPQELFGVAVGAGRVVAVGASGTIVTSADQGISWVSQTSKGAFAFKSVAYGNGLFIAVGTAGNIWRSTDGLTWTNISAKVWLQSSSTVGTLTADLTQVAFGDGTWVVVGNGGTILISGDLPVAVVTNAGAGLAYSSSYNMPSALGGLPEITNVSFVCIKTHSITNVGTYYAGTRVNVENCLRYSAPPTTPVEAMVPITMAFNAVTNSVQVGMNSGGSGRITAGVTGLVWDMAVLPAPTGTGANAISLMRVEKWKLRITGICAS